MANAWRVALKRDAEKALARLPRDIRVRIARTIDELGENPHPSGSLKLTGYQNLYRRRVGAWRIVYAVHDEELIVLVIEIAARGSAYKDL